MSGSKIIIIFLGLFGFWVARHIRNHKTKNTPLVCPSRFDCHAVVHSDYSKFLGVPVEIFGMIYYAFICLASIIFIFVPSFREPLYLFMRVMAVLAIIFSLYLVVVQIFIIKKKCFWCMISALASALILLLLFI